MTVRSRWKLDGAVATGRPVFRKRFYTLGQLRKDVAVLLRQRAELRAIWGRQQRVNPRLREQIMVGVATVNACGFCTYIHQETAASVGAELDFLAELTGIDTVGDVDEDVVVAVLWAQSRAENGLGPAVESVHRQFEQRFNVQQQRDLDTVVRVMHLANLSGNTLEALVWRLRGEPVPGSRLIDELVIGGTYFVGAIPMGIATARQGGKPLRVVLGEAVSSIRAAA